MEESRWTLDELAERVDLALAVDYHGQPSGRVRAVPDGRAIRWYTTIGLIDRPVAHRGRTALYGPRHLLQLVAVKRLQAKGLPLVAIQQELAGATDTQLARVARLPAAARPAGATDPVPASTPPAGDGLPRNASAEAAPPGTPRSATPPSAPRAVRGAARRAGFWRERPAVAFSATAASTAPGAAEALGGQEGRETDPPDPAAGPGPARPTAIGSRGLTTLQGVRLGDGATLLLEPARALSPADLHAILDAARPLLAALRDRGLGGTPDRPSPLQDSVSAGGPVDGNEREGEPRREHP